MHMSTTSATTLITGSVTDVGTAMLAILGAILIVGVGYLVFKFGWKRVKGVVR